MSSLKHRLFLILVAATGVIWLAATCWIYVGTSREVENVLDSRLQEAARMVLSLASSNGIGSPEKDSGASHATDYLTYERQLSCQIWSLDGRLVARSSGAPSESLSDTRTGFSERTIKGETWRVFTAEDPVRNVRVLVGDRLGLREAFVTDIMKGLAAPMLLTVPLLALLIWASLNRGMRPLQALAQDLKCRNADDIDSGRGRKRSDRNLAHGCFLEQPFPEGQ
ncbi:sensor histidine kinase N-terminal domain-containing protein [Bradyrhizobium sp. 13971]